LPTQEPRGRKGSDAKSCLGSLTFGDPPGNLGDTVKR
jgi:hypothetical protein